MSNLKRFSKNLKYDLGLPFYTPASCCLCLSAVAASKDQPLKDWLAVDGDTRIRVYVCPECLPQQAEPEAKAQAQAFVEMFGRVGTVIKGHAGKLKIKRYTFWEWKDGQPQRIQQAGPEKGA